MTNYQRNTAYAEAANYSDAESYISDMLTSSLFVDPADESAGPLPGIAAELEALYNTRALPFSDFLKFIGRTQTELSRRYCIPLRTVQGWALGERECTSWTRLLIAESEGVFARPSKPYALTEATCERYAKACCDFAADSADWSELDPVKFYTTKTPGWESSDNAAGGLSVAWAFHKTPAEIEQEAPQELVKQLVDFINVVIDNELAPDQIAVMAAAINEL